MYYNSKNLINAKYMRSNMTKEESKLWKLLRAHRFMGFKFKRQVLIGNYIVDFLCPQKALIIEVDGGQHNEYDNFINDENRTKYLNKQGYKVLRFWNNEIRDNIEGVYEVIKKNLES